MWWALSLERNSFHFGKDGMSQNMTGQIKKVNETGNYRRTKMKKEMVSSETSGARLPDYATEADPFGYYIGRRLFFLQGNFFTGHLSLIRELGRQRYIVLSISWRRLVRSAGRICIKLPAMRKMAAEKYAELRWRIILYGTCHQKNWNEVILAGLKSCGYIGTQKVKAVVIESCV